MHKHNHTNRLLDVEPVATNWWLHFVYVQLQLRLGVTSSDFNPIIVLPRWNAIELPMPITSSNLNPKPKSVSERQWLTQYGWYSCHKKILFIKNAQRKLMADWTLQAVEMTAECKRLTACLSYRFSDAVLFFLCANIFEHKPNSYRVGQVKWHHFTFLLVTHECIHKILWFLGLWHTQTT